MREYQEPVSDPPPSQASGPRNSPKAVTSGGVRIRVLIPLALTIAALIVAFGISVYVMKVHEITGQCEEVFRTIPVVFQNELDRDASLMSDTLEAMAKDEQLRSAFLAGDRQLLLNRALPLFESMRERHRITHMYFHTPDRVCFLRAHQPKQHGDKIDRFTATEAEKTGELSHGIELGPLGTFTLRVVLPWYQGDRLIGYLEVGEEIEHITEHLRVMFGTEFYTAIHKKFLDRRSWQEGMEMLGRQAQWDRFPSSVIVSRTLQGTPEDMDRYLGKGEHNDTATPDIETSLNGRRYRMAFHELEDAAGNEVGDMVMLRDVTAAYAALHKTMLVGGLICLAVGAGLSAFSYVFLGRVDLTLSRQTASLARTNEELRAEIGKRETTEQKLRGSHGFLQTIIDAIPESMIVIDRTHRIVLANGAAREQAGSIDPVAAQMTCHQLSHHSQTPCKGLADPCPLEQMLATKAPVTVTHRHCDAEGNESVVEISAVPLFDEAGEVVQMIEACRDITERKQAQEKLTATVQELERFNRLAVGREERMIELKREVNEIARKAGIAPPYDSQLVESPKGEPGDA